MSMETEMLPEEFESTKFSKQLEVAIMQQIARAGASTTPYEVAFNMKVLLALENQLKKLLHGE